MDTVYQVIFETSTQCGDALVTAHNQEEAIAMFTKYLLQIGMTPVNVRVVRGPMTGNVFVIAMSNK